MGRDGAAALVTGFFRALEGYDFLLSGAIREAKTLAAADVDAAVKELAAAFDALLATVPKVCMGRGQWAVVGGLREGVDGGNRGRIGALIHWSSAEAWHGCTSRAV